MQTAKNLELLISQRALKKQTASCFTNKST